MSMVNCAASLHNNSTVLAFSLNSSAPNTKPNCTVPNGMVAANQRSFLRVCRGKISIVAEPKLFLFRSVNGHSKVRVSGLL